MYYHISKYGIRQFVLSRSHIDLTVSISGNNVEGSVTTKIQVNYLLCASSTVEWYNQIQHELCNVLYEYNMGKILISAAPDM